MKNKGFSLIELIIALAFLMIICSITFDAYNNSMKSFKALSKGIDGRGNSRIALDFIVCNLKGATNISSTSNCVNLDSHKIYLKNNILRYDYDSEQVANNISGFSVVAMNKLLYRVTVKADGYDTGTVVSLRR
jgi:hypothetical protein